jgi:hypothetical protein
MRCDQCEALMINGVFCHETGCPNQGKVWDSEISEWCREYECPECGTKTTDHDAFLVCCSPDESEEGEPERHCIVDGCFGIYVPTRFAAKFRNNDAYCVLHVTPADWDELEKGPDEPDYWELWDEICQAVEIIDNATGQHYTLEQDGDLFMVAQS